MASMLAFCGLDCGHCPALHAAERLTMEERQKVADRWNAEEGATLTAGEIDCQGCTAREGTIRYCAICPTRQCGLARGLVTCADCPDYGCEKVASVWQYKPEARAALETLRLDAH